MSAERTERTRVAVVECTTSGRCGLVDDLAGKLGLAEERLTARLDLVGDQITALAGAVGHMGGRIDVMLADVERAAGAAAERQRIAGIVGRIVPWAWRLAAAAGGIVAGWLAAGGGG